MYIGRGQFLLLKKIIVGPRTKIVFVSSFFTFAFALLFFALLQNYAHAVTPVLPQDPIHIVAVVDTSDIPAPRDTTILSGW